MLGYPVFETWTARVRQRKSDGMKRVEGQSSYLNFYLTLVRFLVLKLYSRGKGIEVFILQYACLAVTEIVLSYYKCGTCHLQGGVGGGMR